MSATTLIQTAQPARFTGVALATGVGLAPFAPNRPAPLLRLVTRRDAA
jgi:hypothetical protein